MDPFKIITPAIYWLLILVWSYIFIFYIRKLSAKKTSDKFFRLLLIILAIDAFRTLFESTYFGARHTSFSGIIPISVFNFLAQPEIVFFPKIVNLTASLLVLFMIIRKWIPEETNRIDTFNELLKERTKTLKTESINLKTEAQKARENEAKYRNATVNSPFPIMIHAEDGEVILINRSWTKITGYKLEDIATISKWTEKAYGEKHEIVKNYIDELYRINEAIEEGEYTIRTKSGEKRVWTFSSAPLDVLPDGRRMVISSAMDVTERTKSKMKAKERETKLQTTFDAANNVAFILTSYEGKDSKILEFSKGAENIFGYEAKEVIGKSVAMLHTKKDVANFKELQDSINTCKTGFSGESMLIRKSGEKFPALFSLYPVINESGKISSFQGVSIDVSELKTAENAFVESEERLRLSTELANVAIWEFDFSTNNMTRSKTHDSLYGLEFQKKWEFETFLNATHPDDREYFTEITQKSVAPNGPANYKFDFRVVYPNQSIHWLMITGQVIERNPKGEGIIVRGTLIDITDRKLAEEEVKILNKKLEERVNLRTNELTNSQSALLNLVEDLNEKSDDLERQTKGLELANSELESFSYSISHDLRAPLRAINGFSKFLVDDYEELLGEEGKRLIKVIRTNAKQMDQLITDILQLSRLSRNDVRTTNVNMEELVKSVFDEIALPHEKKQFEFIVKKIPASNVDATLIRQVWVNLISNAIKYSIPSDTKKIIINFELNENEITYFIKDFGVGFNPDYKHKLFGIFQRLHHTDEFEGTGVGLAIVQRIIHKHGGEVWAEAKEGKGATFYFSIPIKN